MPWQLSKQFSKFIFQYSIQIYSLFGQTEEEGKDFSEGCKEGRGRVEDYTQEHIIVIRDKKKSLYFSVIRNNLIPLLFIRQPHK